MSGKVNSKKGVVVSAPSTVAVAATQKKSPALTGPLASTKEEADQLPLVAKIINHILTPGSSLSGMMLLFFNVIIFFLFTIWMMFVYVMPTSWIVWTFGFLGGGLALSTNYLLYQILFVVEEPKVEEAEEKGEESDKKKEVEEGKKSEEERKDDSNNKKNKKTLPNEPEEPEAASPTASNTNEKESKADSANNREGSLRKRKAKKEN